MKPLSGNHFVNKSTKIIKYLHKFVSMDTLTVKIYCKEDNRRLRYIAGFIMEELLGLPFDIVTDKRKIGKYPVINYSNDKIPGSLKIQPVSLLFETGVSEQEILISEWNGLPSFFTAREESDIPFDIFAASFFLITRYEEYSNFQPDENGRFSAASSVAYRNGFLKLPLVDLWIREFAKALLKKFHTISFRRNVYSSLLTIGTNQTFKNNGHSLINSIGGFFRDLKRKTVNTGESNQTLINSEKDLVDSYSYITESIESNKSLVKFFFPVGDRTRNQNFPSWKDSDYQMMIKKIAVRYGTGLSISLSALSNYSLICTELSRLKSITEKDLFSCLINDIRLTFPDSYRNLTKAGFTEDFSMGYPDEPGFRAGIARSFNFYDIITDQVTGLRIFPFMLMDTTLFKNNNFNGAQSKEIILKLINETRKVGGLFVSIWHNSSLTEKEEWKDIFGFTLKNQV
jgi:hypothetical protein